VSGYSGPVYLQGGAPYRAINDIIADVTVKEAGVDKLTITKHPVEYGASITDHAFVEPAELTLSIGFSDSGNYDGYVSDAYQALLALQATRQPFTVYTGKRVYQNMLISNIAQTTDQETEYTLNIVVSLQVILFVSLSTSTLPPTDQQSSPQATAEPVNNGAVATQPPPTQDSSWLNTTFGTS
jgi:hypothetical protein